MLDAAVLLSIYHLYILINRRSTHAAHPRQFRNVELSVFVGRIVSVKDWRYVVLRERRSADACALCFGVRHSRLNARSDNPKFEFCKNARHLNKGVGHRVKFSFGAVNRDTADDDKAQFLRSDALNDFAQLLGASCESRHFKGDYTVALACGVEKVG